MSSDFYRRIEVRAGGTLKCLWMPVGREVRPGMRVRVGETVGEVLTVYYRKLKKEQIPEGEEIQ